VLRSVTPNPGVGRLTVRYELASGCRVDLSVYDIAGREVTRLVSEEQGAGRYTVRWDGRTQTGEEAASGVYFAKLKAGSYEASSRAILVR